MNWDRLEHDFGVAEYNSIHETVFLYTGDSQLRQESFQKSCGCTEPVWDAVNKTLKVGLHMNVRGLKSTTVLVQDPAGVTILKVKALVK